MGFLLGFIVGLVVSPLLLAVLSKPIMKWLVKRQLNKMVSNVTDKLSGLQNQFQVKNEDGRQEENSESGEDRSSEGTTSTRS